MSYHASCCPRPLSRRSVDHWALPRAVLVWAVLPIATANCSGDDKEPNASAGGTTGSSVTTGAGTTSGSSPRGGATNTGTTGGAGSIGGGSQSGGATARTGTSYGGTNSIGGSQMGGTTPGSGYTTSGGQSGATYGGATMSGGASQTGGASTGTGSGWVEEWDGATAPRFYTRDDAPNSVQLDVADPAARDGSALTLTLGANPKPRPAGGAEVGTNARFGFGTFASRLRTADCSGQSNAGVVTGLFTYFNDESDTTGDGLPDNSEIDFEWLCAEPQTIYLTMWTDYRDSDSAQKRVGRAINLATGTILYTCYYTAFGDCTETLTGVEAAPSTISALAGYDSSSSYYEYGFDWKADSVVWWMAHPTTGERIVLWDYRGPRARITQIPASFLTNVWHTTDWPPESKPNAIQAPTQAVTVSVDWTRYSAP